MVVFSSRPEIVMLGRIPNTVIYRNILRHPQCETYPGIAIIRIDADLYFANSFNSTELSTPLLSMLFL